MALITEEISMIRVRFYLLIISLIFQQIVFSQPDSKITGFIKFDAFYDSRQVVSAREGHYMLYPEIDGNGSHLPSINFVNFQSRAGYAFSAPDVYFSKVSGLLEADFFGTANGYENLIRLRHALIKLSWSKSALLIGQYWSPLFTIDVFPKVVSFNTGAPFQPFARMPQIRYTASIGYIKFINALTMQRDAFQTIGGRILQQQSGLPGIHSHIQFQKNQFILGGGLYSYTIRPTITSSISRATSGTIYGKISSKSFAIQGKVIYGENLSDHIMLGGFFTTDSGQCSFLKTGSAWLDLYTISAPLSFGLFAGYSTNMGCSSNIDDNNEAFVRGINIADLWRVSPRITYSVHKLRFAFELETTTAMYTDSFTETRQPDPQAGDKPVTNIRGLLAAYLFF